MRFEEISVTRFSVDSRPRSSFRSGQPVITSSSDAERASALIEFHWWANVGVFSAGFTTPFLRQNVPFASLYPQRRRRLDPLDGRSSRERKLRCFYGITTGTTPDRERALAERAFRSSGSFPRVNREHLLWPAVLRDLARNRLPFIPTTHEYSASLGIIAESNKVARPRSS